MGTSRKTSLRIEESGKRVRAYLGGHLVADTTRPSLVWEIPYYPTYYFPEADVRAELVEDGPGKRSPSRGDATAYTVKVNGAEAPGAALRHTELPGLVRLDWDAMDAWFEEDEEVFVHPRDPHTRVDVLASSQHVRVEVDGVTVAESSSPRLLFETGLPVRYYLPKPHVRMDLLEHTETVTHCPYKGTAEYWSVHAGDGIHKDLAWSYPTPLDESRKVAGLICFYSEKVDIFVDGVLQERPKTKF
ncbi:DUF427 domain-containing protein [Actinomadura madurae]|uniref:DUF427 domain-containing protein n=1 Tax=Actinomadura madurae TaxID=1993 RepID=UPI0020D206F9|nr:DUF427 domain-containing protein [Actinomadura madurae]MCP9952732.1 DUF427 domain-containing protein [Actinomadura madurae]MCP9969495.1 DUF427 domain-containing protein [Actinomadura madurae]MCP9981952.1 DUF427 domain-containing protein [Actinomadura madurae]MCQ0006521.1 DUF427 domain-containing protein [Actinomadura madurae]MCQ0018187.1 DUF427 domain-containing protein [Actinomadura madurae]